MTCGVLLQVDVTKMWLTFSSMVLAFTFVFGNSIKTIFEAVIYLFVVHPFDVGDGIFIGSNQPQNQDYYQVTSWP